MENNNDFQITINIGTPQLRTQLGGANKYYLYQISGQDKFSTFTVFRRFSDFVILKNTMIVRWPGCYVPSIPQKKFLGNNQTTFVEFRRRGLKKFLSLISQSKHLWYSDELQLFIKNNSTADVEKSLGNLGKTNSRQIHAKYTTTFPQMIDKLQSDASTKVMQFTAYLKGVIPVLEKLQKNSQVMNQARNKFIQRYDGLFKIFFYDYEDKCISQYVQEKDKDSLSFLHQKENGYGQLRQKFTQANSINAFSFVNELIKEQIRQVLNFLQLLKLRDQYFNLKSKALAKVKDVQLQLTKINSGNQSILSKIKKLSKQQQLQQNRVDLQKAKKQQKQANQICQVIDYMLKEKQIDNFKRIRKNNYYKVVKQLAKAQKIIYQLQAQIWQKVCGQEYTSEKEDKQEDKIQELKRQKVIVHFQNQKNQQSNQKLIQVKKQVEQVVLQQSKKEVMSDDKSQKSDSQEN